MIILVCTPKCTHSSCTHSLLCISSGAAQSGRNCVPSAVTVRNQSRLLWTVVSRPFRSKRNRACSQRTRPMQSESLDWYCCRPISQINLIGPKNQPFFTNNLIPIMSCLIMFIYIRFLWCFNLISVFFWFFFNDD